MGAAVSNISLSAEKGEEEKEEEAEGRRRSDTSRSTRSAAVVIAFLPDDMTTSFRRVLPYTSSRWSPISTMYRTNRRESEL